MKKLYLLFVILFLYNNLKAENAVDYYKKAKIRYSNRYYIASIELLNKSIQINPYYKESYKLLGDVYNSIDKFDSALFYYKKALNLEPEYLDAMFALSDVYYNQNEYDSAINLLNTIKDEKQNNLKLHIKFMKNYTALNDWKNINYHNNYVQKIKPDYLLAKYYIAEYYKNNDNIDSAIKIYQSIKSRMLSDNNVIEKDEIIPEVFLSLAEIYMKLNDYNFSLKNYDEAEKYFSTKKQAKIQKAKLLNYMKKYDYVIKLWENFPIYYLNAYHIGCAYYQKAIEYLENDMKSVSKTLLDKAFYYFKGALALNSEDHIAHYMLNKLLLRIRDVGDKDRIAAANSTYVMAVHKINNGQDNMGLYYLKKSIELNPQNKENRYLFVDLLKKKKLFNTAIFNLKRLIDLDNTDLKFKDELSLLNYNLYSDDKLKQYELNNPENNNIKFRLAIKINFNLLNVLHYNINRYIKDFLFDYTQLFGKFQFMFIPYQYKNISDIESYTRTINADALAIINFNESENLFKTQVKLYKITKMSKNIFYEKNKLLRGQELLLKKKTIIYEGKNKITQTLNSLYDLFDSNYPAVGFIKKLYSYSCIVNIGSKQNIKKGSKLSVYKRTAYKDIFLGNIVVHSITENNSLCYINDKKVLDGIKLSDVVIKSEIKK